MKESGELIFLRYAFPVIGNCGKVNVNPDELLEFEKMLKYGGSPDKKRLEEIFPNAVVHLKSWSPKDVRDYWCVEHNKIVGNNTACMVYGFEVSHVPPPENKEICIVRVRGVKSLKAKSYLELEPGDFVSVHAFQVAEKLSQENYNRYFRLK